MVKEMDDANDEDRYLLLVAGETQAIDLPW